jgi:hypothetical protein
MIDCSILFARADEWLEPDAGRLAHPALRRRRWRSNALPLPDIGADAASGLVHIVRETAANVHDVVEANSLLHGEKTDVHANAGYRGAHKRADARVVKWHVTMRQSERAALDKNDALGSCFRFRVPVASTTLSRTSLGPALPSPMQSLANLIAKGARPPNLTAAPFSHRGYRRVENWRAHR